MLFFQLNSNNVYSKLVCTACDEHLKNFSFLQKDFITKQLKLQKFVVETEEKEKSKVIDIKNEVNNYAVVYLNPIVTIKSEPEINSHLICEDESKEINYSNTHSPEFKEEKKRINVQMRKSNDPNK